MYFCRGLNVPPPSASFSPLFLPLFGPGHDISRLEATDLLGQATIFVEDRATLGSLGHYTPFAYNLGREERFRERKRKKEEFPQECENQGRS